MTRTRATKAPGRARSQSGAVLYVGLIMLILLALLGIVGMQVSTLQERMSSNFLAANMAFQNAEAQVRGREADIASGTAYEYEVCDTPFDAKAWADGIADTVVSDVRTRNIGICTGQCSAQVGADTQLCSMYRTTAFSRDQATVGQSSSMAAIDTIYIQP